MRQRELARALAAGPGLCRRVRRPPGLRLMFVTPSRRDVDSTAIRGARNFAESMADSLDSELERSSSRQVPDYYRLILNCLQVCIQKVSEFRNTFKFQKHSELSVYVNLNLSFKKLEIKYWYQVHRFKFCRGSAKLDYAARGSSSPRRSRVDADSGV